MHAHKRTLYLVLLTLALLLVAAVPAWAATLTVNPSQVKADGEDVTYTLSVTGLAIAPSDVMGTGKEIGISYPVGFTVKSGMAEVTVVVDSKPYVLSCTVTPDTTNTNQGKIAVSAGSLPSAGTVSAVTIKNLLVTSTIDLSQTSGKVQVTFATSPLTTVEASLTWIQAVNTVTITAPSAPVKAGSSFQVIGKVTDVLNAGVRNKTVTVTITDLAGQAVATQTATTVSTGDFTTPAFNLTKAGNYVIKATCEGVTGSTTLTVEPAAASKVVFIEKPGTLTKAVKSDPFTVGLQDQYGNDVTPTSGVDVFLSAADANGNPAGVFKDSSDNVITKVTLTSATQSFTFIPSVTGTVSITALSGSLTPATAQYNVGAPQAPSSIQLQLAPESTTTDGKPIAGTKITATLTTDVAADKDYTVDVKLYPSSGTGWATGPTGAVTLAKGQKQATFEITTDATNAVDRVLTVEVSFTPTGASSAIKASASIGPFVARAGNVPSSITLTLTPAATDPSDPTKALEGSPITATVEAELPADKDYSITVSLGTPAPTWASAPSSVTLAKGQKQATFTITTTSGAATNILTVTVTVSGIGSDTKSVEFVAPPATFPFDFNRYLVRGWQVLSVPVKLDKSLVDLLGGADKFEALYLYDPVAGWKQYSDMNDTQKYGQPLVGYVVKMKQAVLAQANYLKVTATQGVPPTLALKQGWNLVGASGDKLADVLASVKGKYSTIVNPGLGNKVNWPSVTAESIVSVNPSAAIGDAYWVFMTADGTLAGLMAPPVQ